MNKQYHNVGCSTIGDGSPWVYNIVILYKSRFYGKCVYHVLKQPFSIYLRRSMGGGNKPFAAFERIQENLYVFALIGTKPKL